MSVWKNKKGIWRFSYRLPHGKKRQSGSNPSKVLARQAHDAGVLRTWQAENGLVDAASSAHASSAGVTLAKHLAAYVRHLKHKHRSADHVRVVEARVAILFGHGKMKHLRDITPTSITRAMSVYAEAGNVSQRTVAHALTQTKSFLNWCVEDNRLAANPISRVRAPKVTREVHPRRAATPDEVSRLLIAAGRRLCGGRWTPQDRSALLLIMIGGGLRKKEIRSLTPESFRLDGRHPEIVVHAHDTKGGVRADQGVSVELADLLRPWVAGKKPGRPVFPSLGPQADVSQIVKRCCEAAGVPYRNADGFLDGHALRHTYGTLMAQATDVETLRVLMRHKDIGTTQRYLHTTRERKRAAIEKMPSFLPQQNGGGDHPNH
jgi:integrase